MPEPDIRPFEQMTEKEQTRFLAAIGKGKALEILCMKPDSPDEKRWILQLQKELAVQQQALSLREREFDREDDRRAQLKQGGEALMAALKAYEATTSGVPQPQDAEQSTTHAIAG